MITLRLRHWAVWDSGTGFLGKIVLCIFIFHHKKLWQTRKLLYSAYLLEWVYISKSREINMSVCVCVLVFCVCMSYCVSKSVCARVFAFMSVYVRLYVFECVPATSYVFSLY